MGRRRRVERRKITVDYLTVGPFSENCYIVSTESNDAIIIDAGHEVDQIIEFIKRKKMKPLAIFSSHAHIDHVDGVGELKNHFKIPFYLHKEDLVILKSVKQQAASVGLECNLPPFVDKFFKDSETITLGDLKIKVLHTPGHTPGGSCFLIEDMLFSGDTLFAGSIGRTDFPGGSYDELISSIKKKILPLGDDIKVFPGHGWSTTIGEERKNNPFIVDADRSKGII